MRGGGGGGVILKLRTEVNSRCGKDWGKKICGGSHSVPGSSLEVILSPHRALSLLLHDRTLTLVDLAMFLAVGKMTEVRKMKSDFPGMQSLTQGSKSLVRKNGLLCN